MDPYQAENRRHERAWGVSIVSRSRNAKRDRLPIVALLLSLFACARVEGPGDRIALPEVGALVGRVDLSAGDVRDPVGRPAVGRGSVLVYIESSDASLSSPPDGSPLEIQIGSGMQEPQLALVIPNRPFRFINLDPIHHEPFSLDAPNDFRVRIGGREPSAPIQLPHGGFVRVFCGLHPAEMFALIVSPAEHVLAVDDDGSFAIPNVRPGDYRVRAAGVDAESAAVPVRVARGETLRIQLKLSPRGTR